MSIIYLFFALAAVVVVSLLLDPIQVAMTSSDTYQLSPQLLLSTARHLITSPAQMLLVPLTVYSGLEQTVFAEDFIQVGGLEHM